MIYVYTVYTVRIYGTVFVQRGAKKGYTSYTINKVIIFFEVHEFGKTQLDQGLWPGKIISKV